MFDVSVAQTVCRLPHLALTAVESQAVLCLQVGGHWLSWWMVAAAAVSQIGQFEAEMSSDSFQLLGMAERGFLPKALGRRSKHDTPTVSLLMVNTANWMAHVIVLHIQETTLKCQRCCIPRLPGMHAQSHCSVLLQLVSNSLMHA